MIRKQGYKYWVATTCLLLGVTACSKKSSVESSVIGRWSCLNGAAQLEFLKGGVFTGGNKAGQWTITDNAGIVVTYQTLGTSVAAHGNIVNGTLQLQDPEQLLVCNKI